MTAESPLTGKVINFYGILWEIPSVRNSGLSEHQHAGNFHLVSSYCLPFFARYVGTFSYRHKSLRLQLN